MIPLSNVPRETLARITTIFTDVDDTLTIHGRMTSGVLAALERLQAANLRVVPVTGRPGGWCHGLVRAWPIAAIVAENGGIAYWIDEANKQRTLHAEPDGATREKQYAQLLQIQKNALEKFPMFNAAQDQFMRSLDIAFDHNENTQPPIPTAQIEALLSFLKTHGLHTAASTIHAHGRFNELNKFTMTKHFVETVWKTPMTRMIEESIFIGDSNNDEPMFANFKHTVAVANYSPTLAVLPRYVTRAREGDGFVELANAVLAAR